MPLHKLDDMKSDAYTEAWVEGPQSTKFYTRVYKAKEESSKAVLVFVHGFAEHVGRYTEAHPVFAEHGISVFAFDQRGFGRTALDKANKSKSSAYGKTSGPDQMGDIKWAIQHAQKEFPGLPVFLAGHSMGGGEVLNFATRYADDAKAMLTGVIACSPLVHQTTPASKIQRWAGGMIANGVPYFTIPTPLNYDDLSHDENYNKMCKTDELSKLQGTLRGVSDMLSWGELLLTEQYKKWPKTLPVLLVHGTGDKITSSKAAENYIEKLAADDKETILYTDGYHELVHEPAHREKLLNDMIAFIEKHIPKPSAVEAKL
ncbi:Hydrolase-4 domain-containing protein [Mycena indigotica]|uniref:Hydrolase-4 domain-containing protein n=1 Tax=Mycena indigotica TaxID=2126181 RepID=A0A8H6VTC4_9AGAR|nr:Hydrolase-4 domain-containing protein [Mycena indigotica]KAF7289338.1 Hydrolase-4 domain-containing protein [Mycena indigotica]